MTNKHDPELKARVLEEYVESADSVDVIAARTGVNRGTIAKWAKADNLTRKRATRRRRVLANVREGSASKLKDCDGAWVYGTDGIARWAPKDGVA